MQIEPTEPIRHDIDRKDTDRQLVLDAQPL